MLLLDANADRLANVKAITTTILITLCEAKLILSIFFIMQISELQKYKFY